FATKKEAEAQVQEDIQITEKIMHQKFGIPFLPMKRPDWDRFAGAEYTIGSDVFMPDGKLIQQPSTHMMGQKFSKVFNAKFKNEQGKENYLWTTAYGPAMSRILVSVISMHGDDKGLVLPFSIAPLKAVIIPIYTSKNKEKVLKYSRETEKKLNALGLNSEIDLSDKRPGEKYHSWELKGVPFRLEIGEKETKNKNFILFTRDTGKKETLKDLRKLKKLGEEYDKRLREKAENSTKGKIINCKTKEQVKKAMKDEKIARVNWCHTDEKGVKCAEYIEKQTNAEVRGT
ncbi:unnamed protein product, partial [marine sediment metagenome]